MARITPVKSTQSGAEIDFTDLTTGADGDYFENTEGNVYVVLRADVAAGLDFTITPLGDTSEYVPGHGNMTLSAQTVTVPQDEYRIVGPFPPLGWNGDTGAGNSNAIGLQVTSNAANADDGAIAGIQI